MLSKKTLEEKIKVMQAALEGKPITFISEYGINCVCNGDKLAFDWNNYDYNVYEEPKTKPSINWEHVSKDFNYMATDENGYTYLYIGEPDMGTGHWFSYPSGKSAEVFSSCIPGTCDWKESLVKRPD